MESFSTEISWHRGKLNVFLEFLILTSTLLWECRTSQMKNGTKVTGNLQGTSKSNEAPHPIKIVHYSFKDFCFENIWTQSVTEALSQIFPSYLFFDRDTVIVSHYLDFWWPLCSWKNSVLLVLTFLADIVKMGKETIETVSHEEISVSKETRPAQWWG